MLYLDCCDNILEDRPLLLAIPSYGDQPLHFHLDINYVVEVPLQEIKHSLKESHNIGWFTKQEALQLNIHQDSRTIIQKLL